MFAHIRTSKSSNKEVDVQGGVPSMGVSLVGDTVLHVAAPTGAPANDEKSGSTRAAGCTAGEVVDITPSGVREGETSRTGVADETQSTCSSVSVDSGEKDGGVEECKMGTRTDRLADSTHCTRSSASEHGRSDTHKEKNAAVDAGASCSWRWTRERNCCDFDFARCLVGISPD